MMEIWHPTCVNLFLYDETKPYGKGIQTKIDMVLECPYSDSIVFSLNNWVRFPSLFLGELFSDFGGDFFITALGRILLHIWGVIFCPFWRLLEFFFPELHTLGSFGLLGGFAWWLSFFVVVGSLCGWLWGR